MDSFQGMKHVPTLKEDFVTKELNVNLHVPINSIAWHPSQHLIVFSSFGSDYPIFFFEYVPSDDVYK